MELTESVHSKTFIVLNTTTCSEGLINKCYWLITEMYCWIVWHSENDFNLDFCSLAISEFPGLREQRFLECFGGLAGSRILLAETRAHSPHRG